MRKEEFYYDSRDGKTKLHAVRYLPDADMDIRCIVQIVHGMSEYFERYEEFAEYLTSRGCLVTGEDHIGHGKSVSKVRKFGYFCEQDPATVLVRDVHRLKKSTQALYPNIPYVIMGHSMGSFLVRNYMFRYGTGISGAVILGTGMQSMGILRLSKLVTQIQEICFGSEHVSKLIDNLLFRKYNARVENPATEQDWLTRDREKVDEYIKDPLCGFVFTVNGFSTLFELIARLHDQNNLKYIPKEMPVLMVSGDADPVGDYGKGVKRAYDSLKGIGMQNVTLKMYEGARHELLNETNRTEIMDFIYHWLDDNFFVSEQC